MAKQSKQDLELSKGYKTVVDQKGFELFNKWKWTYDRGYAYRRDRKRGKVYLHREIAGAKGVLVVDHINGDTLDNRASNLRLCTRSENACNSKKRTNHKKGVYFYKRDKKWVAQIWKNYKNYYIGRFDTEKEASKAYQAKALTLHGAFANYGEEK